MKKIATAILLFCSLSLFAQKQIKDISYYNSLAWKDEASFVVYVDKTYKLPSEEKRKIVYKTINYTVVPYSHYYPYNYNNNFYYTNGFTPVYYTPIRFGRRHRRH